jgi:uncharacterized membrane protein
MRLRSTFPFLLLTTFSFTLLNNVDLQLPIEGLETALDTSNVAEARSSGGRSSGGSFSRSSSSSSSTRSSSTSSRPSSSTSSTRSSFGSSSTPSRATSTPIDTNRGNTGGRVQGGSFQRPSAPALLTPSNPRTTGYNSDTYRSTTRENSVSVPIPANPPVYNPVPTTSQPSVSNSVAPNVTSNSTASKDDLSLLDWVIFIGIVEVFFAVSSGGLMLLALCIWAIGRSLNSGTASAKNELENDTVTVSKVQVALLAQARSIQSQLSSLTLNADTQTSEGLAQLLQESALALLRSPEYWTHVSTSSQSVRSREEAENLFTQLSIRERSKFNVEALAHVDGKISQRNPILPDSTESADYIVVTLLVGTAYDKPLFGEIRTTESLQQALEQMAAIPSQHLLVFELLWSPQAETDSLTYDELLTEYTDMISIA